MAKTITTKYGTKINVDGLTPEQVARVRSTAEDKGPYGKKAAALADTLRKKAQSAGGNAATGAPTAPVPNDPADPNDPGVKGTGDTYKTVDAFLDAAFQGLQPLDLSGAPKVLTADDLQGQRGKVYDSIYATQTKDLDKRKAQDLEAQKQELANRGIPLNFANDPSNPNNLYSRAIGDVTNRYDTLYQDAANAANAGADQGLATYVDANTKANDQFLKGALGSYQSQLDAISTGGNIIQTLMTKYGIDEATAQAKLQARTQKEIARMNNANRGNGGRSSGDGGSGVIVGGTAPGFGV